MMVVAGVDEAGRGPLAGPVYAAAVILPKGCRLPGLDDSKALSPAQRDALEIAIKKRATAWAVARAEVDEIDRLNILWAAMEAMSRAIEALTESPSRVLIDGNRLPKRLSVPGEAIIGGDAKVRCISAASVLAKTARDRYMREVASEFPQYGFERHFGYPTPEHISALEEFGPCPLHRRSFRRCSDQLALELV
jgi:ribonuclease HII